MQNSSKTNREKHIETMRKVIEEEFPEFADSPAVKNQHYVPQFYLRNFSNHPQLKTIYLYRHNQKNSINPSIKSTCCMDYTYGEDSLLEWAFSTSERDASKIIKKIMANPKSHGMAGQEYFTLLEFIVYLHARSIRLIEEHRMLMRSFGEEIVKPFGITDWRLKFPTEDFPYVMQLDFFKDNIWSYLRLQPVILINKTPLDFVTSDCPVCMYNAAFIKEAFIEYGHSYGAMTSGIQIYLPLSNTLAIMLFDPEYYDLISKEIAYHELSEYQVKELNKIAIYNSRHCVIYGNPNKNPNIEKLSENLKKKSPEATDSNMVRTLPNRDDIIHSSCFCIKGKANITFLRQKKRITNMFSVIDDSLHDRLKARVARFKASDN